MKRNIFGILKTLIASYVLTGILLVLSAFLMYKMQLGELQIRLFVILIYGVATIAGGFIYGKIKGCKRVLNGALIGALYFVLLILISCIANGGFESGIGKNLISLAICVVGGIIGGIIS